MTLLSSLYDLCTNFPLMETFERRLVKWWLASRFSGGGIVIGGCGRSGTTLLLGMLSAHNEICAIPKETWALYPRIQPLRIVKKLRPICVKSPHAAWWCEKTPRNILNVPEILSFLGPQGRVLHIVRDGRDVVTSRHPKNPSTYWVPVERWIRDVSAGLAAEQHSQVTRVRYEDLVQYPEKTMRNILQFIEIDFQETILHWEKAGSVRQSRAWHSKATATHSDSVGRWRKPEHAERIDEFYNYTSALDLLEDLGYR